MRGSWEFSSILEALDRIQYHVTLYLAQVYRTVAGSDPLSTITAGQLVIPAMTAKDLGLDTLSDAVQKYIDQRTGLRFDAPERWSGSQLLDTTALGTLDPMEVFNWAQAAKAHIRRFVGGSDRGAQIYINIEAKRDAILASEGAFVINRSDIRGAFNQFSKPLSPSPMQSLLLSSGEQIDPLRMDSGWQGIRRKTDWEFVRPRISVLGKTIDLDRPAPIIRRALFGLRSPEPELVKTAVRDVEHISPVEASEIFGTFPDFISTKRLGKPKPSRTFFDIGHSKLVDKYLADPPGPKLGQWEPFADMDRDWFLTSQRPPEPAAETTPSKPDPLPGLDKIRTMYGLDEWLKPPVETTPSKPDPLPGLDEIRTRWAAESPQFSAGLFATYRRMGEPKKKRR